MSKAVSRQSLPITTAAGMAIARSKHSALKADSLQPYISPLIELKKAHLIRFKPVNF
jgi:hypothetical protein